MLSAIYWIQTNPLMTVRLGILPVLPVLPEDLMIGKDHHVIDLRMIDLREDLVPPGAPLPHDQGLGHGNILREKDPDLRDRSVIGQVGLSGVAEKGSLDKIVRVSIIREETNKIFLRINQIQDRH